MDHVHHKSVSFCLHCIFSVQNSTIPWQNPVRIISTIYQYARHAYTALDKTIRKGILIRSRWLCHIDFYVLSLLLYLFTFTREVVNETETAYQ